MARKLACLFYRLIKHGQQYVDKDIEYYEARHREQQIRRFDGSRRAARGRPSQPSHPHWYLCAVKDLSERQTAEPWDSSVWGCGGSSRSAAAPGALAIGASLLPNGTFGRPSGSTELTLTWKFKGLE